MVRSLITIILLMMIFITASGIPLYADTMDLNVFLNTAVSIEDAIGVDTRITTLSPSESQLEIAFSSSKSIMPLEFNEIQPITINLYQGDKKIGPINLLEMDPSFSKVIKDMTNEHSSILTLDLPQTGLNIPNGHYELEVVLHLKNLEEAIITNRAALSYATEVNYLASADTIPDNSTALTLYFPENSSKYLIPITRAIPYTIRPLRATLDHLSQGPYENLGLLQDTGIPDIQDLGLSRGVAEVYLSNDIGIYHQYASSARLAVESIVNSLSSIREVEGVQFYFNNQIVTEGFHGMAIDTPLYKEVSPEIYVGYVTEKKHKLLLPISTHHAISSITEIFEALKYNNSLITYTYRIQPTVPMDVELLSYTLEEGVLSLHLNSSFLRTFEENHDRGRFMIDALLYTFTSLEEIDAVVFQVENPSTTIPEGVILDEALKPPNYINFEKN